MGPVGSDSHRSITKTLKTLTNNRTKYRMATLLISGHAPLNYHLYKINKSDTKTCPTCELEDETVAHLVGNCPRLAQLRYQHLNTHYGNIETIFHQNNLLKILDFTHHTGRFKDRREEEADNNAVT